MGNIETHFSILKLNNQNHLYRTGLFLISRKNDRKLRSYLFLTSSQKNIAEVCGLKKWSRRSGFSNAVFCTGKMRDESKFIMILSGYMKGQ